MLPEAAEEARAMVAAVRHDPALRLELASRFYDDRPGRASIRAYRRAELAVPRWQVSRARLPWRAGSTSSAGHRPAPGTGPTTRASWPPTSSIVTCARPRRRWNA